MLTYFVWLRVWFSGNGLLWTR